jgi:hypothetical protein
MALDLNKAPPIDEKSLPDLNKAPPGDDEILPDLNKPIDGEEFLQYHSDLDGYVFPGGQQQRTSSGNYDSISLFLNRITHAQDYYMNMCQNLTTLPSCLMLSKHINQLREERSYQT